LNTHSKINKVFHFIGIVSNANAKRKLAQGENSISGFKKSSSLTAKTGKIPR